MKKSGSILALSYNAAKAFFLRHDAYTNIDLPDYFNFSGLLEEIDKIFEEKSFTFKTEDRDQVNHSILFNSDGRHGWRRLEFIHPVLYVGLVRTITEEKCWKRIQKRFADFRQCNLVECLSIPVIPSAESSQSHKALTIQNWKKTEQRSIELALEHERILHTDIANCYGSIYTHSIDWAMHDKEEAKKDKSNREGRIGAEIDKAIRGMRYGQTNGIPQGSVLMDFIAEMVLGYADMQINKSIKSAQKAGAIRQIKIIRYRDDYRIFADNEAECEGILKIIANVIIGMGMRINPSKTIVSHDVVRSSVKADKLAWLEKPRINRPLQNQLLLIHGHAKQYPNAGSLLSALTRFYKVLRPKEQLPHDVLPMISIVTDIAVRNPKTYRITSAIIGKLLELLPDEQAREVVCGKIVRKFQKTPNSGLMEVWIQRIMMPNGIALDLLKEPLTQIKSLGGEISSIWENGWTGSKELEDLLKKPDLIIDEKVKDEMGKVPSMGEVAMWDPYG